MGERRNDPVTVVTATDEERAQARARFRQKLAEAEARMTPEKRAGVTNLGNRLADIDLLVTTRACELESLTGDDWPMASTTAGCWAGSTWLSR